MTLQQYFPYLFRLPSNKPPVYLTPEHEEILTSCIYLTRTDIHALQSQVNNLHCNLLTIARCIEQNLHPFPTPGTDEYEQRHAVDTLIRNYGPKCETPKKISTSNTETLMNMRMQCPSSLIQRPQDKCQQPIALPTSMDKNDLEWFIEQKKKPEIKLQLLVLKKVELAVEVDELEGQMAFWVTFCEELNQKAKKNTEHPRLPQSPYPGVFEDNHTIIYPWHHRSTFGANTIKRKEVPIRTMLERLQEMEGRKIGDEIDFKEGEREPTEDDSAVDFILDDEGERRSSAKTSISSTGFPFWRRHTA